MATAKKTNQTTKPERPKYDVIVYTKRNGGIKTTFAPNMILPPHPFTISLPSNTMDEAMAKIDKALAYLGAKKCVASGVSARDQFYEHWLLESGQLAWVHIDRGESPIQFIITNMTPSIEYVPKAYEHKNVMILDIETADLPRSRENAMALRRHAPCRGNVNVSTSFPPNWFIDADVP